MKEVNKESKMKIEDRIEIFKVENKDDLEGGCFEGWDDDDIRMIIEENLRGDKVEIDICRLRERER